MINDFMFMVKNDPVINRYLKLHSHWYEELILDNNKFDIMIQEMKKELKINPEDKLEDLTKKIELFSSILNVLS